MTIKNSKVMELYIDTTEQDRVNLKLNGWHLEKTVQGLSESLLIEIEKFLETNMLQPKDLTRITVKRGPGGFSSTRTGVATANALAFALGIPEQNTKPKYNKHPHITKPKHFQF